ncbi:nuclease-related domain-containing DEAD/DEAH box helicase [Stomatohabitans albus]|uniref:nuclease-related domain-containing DEAD/DEAH box helicase n=1 Tax=Stomatohabitans albus TaxID=3110766 RepID=UPI00300D3924
MAELIPSAIDSNAPPGERAIFEALQGANGTDHWVVFHSLNLARHKTQRQGEIDFVILIPGEGIVVLEVKSHERIARRSDGKWEFNGKLAERSPFKQADNNKWTLMSYLKSFVDTSGIPFAHVVWFTGAPFKTNAPHSIEFEDWQVLDIDDLRSGVPGAIARVLRHSREHDRRANARVKQGGLTPDVVEEIKQHLVGSFDIARSVRDIRNEQKAQMLRLLDEQYEIIDALDDNMRVMIDGAAGTGKSFLAVEATRRIVKEGKSCLLVCYNVLLGKRLQALTAGLRHATVGPLLDLVVDQTGIQVPAPEASVLERSTFWNESLPLQAIEMYRTISEEERFDAIIIDEAQDLIRPVFLDLFDVMVKGGLAGGNVWLFGDFTRQLVYVNDDIEGLIRERMPDVTKFKLTKNCRNSPIIGQAATEMSLVDGGVRSYLRADEGPGPNHVTLATDEQAQLTLGISISELFKRGYTPKDIVILSHRRNGSLVERAVEVVPELLDWVVPYEVGDPAGEKIRFTTIQSFKGMESPAVILTDVFDPDKQVDDRHGADINALKYIGMTRALFDLITITVDPDANAGDAKRT